jgi:uncharacterized membrane protein
MANLSALNLTAFVLFMVCWLGYEPLLSAFARRGGVINTDMTVVRTAWMRNMGARDNRFMDGQLLGHALSSASFLASSNLILIAAVAGALFGGERTFRSASSLAVIRTSSQIVFEGQLALVLVALARGLLDFIWSIRQMNYCLAAFGAAPLAGPPEVLARYGDLTAGLLNPALSAFNHGVRSYYFALAAAAWLFGPWFCITATLGAVVLLLWRQRRSRASTAIAGLRAFLEDRSSPAGGGGP